MSSKNYKIFLGINPNTPYGNDYGEGYTAIYMGGQILDIINDQKLSDYLEIDSCGRDTRYDTLYISFTCLKTLPADVNVNLTGYVWDSSGNGEEVDFDTVIAASATGATIKLTYQTHQLDVYEFDIDVKCILDGYMYFTDNCYWSE